MVLQTKKKKTEITEIFDSEIGGIKATNKNWSNRVYAANDVKYLHLRAHAHYY